MKNIEQKYNRFYVLIFPDFPDVKVWVNFSHSTESVYVGYYWGERQVKVRFSDHYSVALLNGDVVDGNRPPENVAVGVLSRLGLIQGRKKEIISREGVIRHNQVGEKQLKLAEEKGELITDVTLRDLKNLPAGTDISQYYGRIIKSHESGEWVRVADMVVKDRITVRECYEYDTPNFKVIQDYEYLGLPRFKVYYGFDPLE